MSQSETVTSLSQGDGRPGRGWRVLIVGGLGVRAQDMFKPLAEWFYATEYISLASLAFRDLSRRIIVVFFN